MRTLVIYDNSGKIYMQMSGAYEIPNGGVQYLELDTPEEKIITSVDTSVIPNIPIFSDIPKSEIEKQIDNIKNDNELLKGCVMELASVVYA